MRTSGCDLSYVWPRAHRRCVPPCAPPEEGRLTQLGARRVAPSVDRDVGSAGTDGIDAVDSGAVLAHHPAVVIDPQAPTREARVEARSRGEVVGAVRR